MSGTVEVKVETEIVWREENGKEELCPGVRESRVRREEGGASAE